MKGAIAFLAITFVGAVGAAVELPDAAVPTLVFWFLGAIAGVLFGVLFEASMRRGLIK